jgi:hypothetical protein
MMGKRDGRIGDGDREIVYQAGQEDGMAGPKTSECNKERKIRSNNEATGQAFPATEVYRLFQVIFKGVGSIPRIKVISQTGSLRINL